MLAQVIVKLESAVIPVNMTNMTYPGQQYFYTSVRVGTDEVHTQAEAIDVDVEPVSTNLVGCNFIPSTIRRLRNSRLKSSQGIGIAPTSKVHQNKNLLA